MALAECGECGNKVWTQAKACPKCGAPPSTYIEVASVPRKNTSCTGMILWLLAGLVVVMVAAKACDDAMLKGIDRSRKAAAAAPTAAPAVASRPDPTQAPRPTPVPTKQRSMSRGIEAFEEILNDKHVIGTLVVDIAPYGTIDGLVTLRMTNDWHGNVYQVRLQAAQNLQRMWASCYAPDDPDKARIRLTDYNGNEVGGSRAWGGSLIWVQE